MIDKIKNLLSNKNKIIKISAIMMIVSFLLPYGQPTLKNIFDYGININSFQSFGYILYYNLKYLLDGLKMQYSTLIMIFLILVLLCMLVLSILIVVKVFKNKYNNLIEMVVGILVCLLVFNHFNNPVSYSYSYYSSSYGMVYGYGLGFYTYLFFGVVLLISLINYTPSMNYDYYDDGYSEEEYYD